MAADYGADKEFAVTMLPGSRREDREDHKRRGQPQAGYKAGTAITCTMKDKTPLTRRDTAVPSRIHPGQFRGSHELWTLFNQVDREFDKRIDDRTHERFQRALPDERHHKRARQLSRLELSLK